MSWQLEAEAVFLAWGTLHSRCINAVAGSGATDAADDAVAAIDVAVGATKDFYFFDLCWSIHFCNHEIFDVPIKTMTL